MLNDGDYWYRWADTTEDPSDAAIDAVKADLRGRGLRLCVDNEGMLVTTINDVA